MFKTQRIHRRWLAALPVLLAMVVGIPTSGSCRGRRAHCFCQRSNGKVAGLHGESRRHGPGATNEPGSHA
jgi:hypothetical protein